MKTLLLSIGVFLQVKGNCLDSGKVVPGDFANHQTAKVLKNPIIQIDDNVLNMIEP